MTNKNVEAAQLRYAFIQQTLVLVILGAVAIGAAVGVLLGNEHAQTVLGAVVPVLALALGYPLATRKRRR
jgi:Na+/citrate or Na+/malate symporter